MPKLIPCKYTHLKKMLQKWGFIEREASGSHVFFRHPDGRTTLAPKRKAEISKGLLRKILNDIDVSVEEYEKLRKSI